MSNDISVKISMNELCELRRRAHEADEWSGVSNSNSDMGYFIGLTGEIGLNE